MNWVITNYEQLLAAFIVSVLQKQPIAVHNLHNSISAENSYH